MWSNSFCIDNLTFVTVVDKVLSVTTFTSIEHHREFFSRKAIIIF